MKSLFKKVIAPLAVTCILGFVSCSDTAKDTCAEGVEDCKEIHEATKITKASLKYTADISVKAISAIDASGACTMLNLEELGGVIDESGNYYTFSLADGKTEGFIDIDMQDTWASLEFMIENATDKASVVFTTDKLTHKDGELVYAAEERTDLQSNNATSYDIAKVLAKIKDSTLEDDGCALHPEFFAAGFTLSWIKQADLEQMVPHNPLGPDDESGLKVTGLYWLDIEEIKDLDIVGEISKLLDSTYDVICVYNMEKAKDDYFVGYTIYDSEDMATANKTNLPFTKGMTYGKYTMFYMNIDDIAAGVAKIKNPYMMRYNWDLGEEAGPMGVAVAATAADMEKLK